MTLSNSFHCSLKLSNAFFGRTLRRFSKFSLFFLRVFTPNLAYSKIPSAEKKLRIRKLKLRPFLFLCLLLWKKISFKISGAFVPKSHISHQKHWISEGFWVTGFVNKHLKFTLRHTYKHIHTLKRGATLLHTVRMRM